MKTKTILWAFFSFVVILQLYVPANMIWEQNSIIKSGETFRFRTAPVDPVDIFRGRYIALSFADNRYELKEDQEWSNGETIFVRFKKDDHGYAIIDSISKDRPNDYEHYLKTTVAYVVMDNPQVVNVSYPFDRLYMAESKAENAEGIYRKEGLAGERETYGLVSIKGGRAVLLDVFIDDVSIKELAERKSN